MHTTLLVIAATLNSQEMTIPPNPAQINENLVRSSSVTSSPNRYRVLVFDTFKNYESTWRMIIEKIEFPSGGTGVAKTVWQKDLVVAHNSQMKEEFNRVKGEKLYGCCAPIESWDKFTLNFEFSIPDGHRWVCKTSDVREDSVKDNFNVTCKSK